MSGGDLSPAVTLGGRSLPVAPLTIGQLRTVVPLFRRVAEAAAGGLDEAVLGDMAAIIQAGLEAASPDWAAGLGVASVLDLPARLDEVLGAVDTVARTAGLMPAAAREPVPGGPPPGESSMGEGAAGQGSTGTASSPGSAGAPAGPGTMSSGR